MKREKNRANLSERFFSVSTSAAGAVILAAGALSLLPLLSTPNLGKKMFAS